MKSERNPIPRRPLQFFRWYCHPNRLEELEGDLEEVFHQRVSTKGSRMAHWMLWADVIRSFRPYALKKNLLSNSIFNPNIMLHNYLKITLRNLKKSKSFSAINIIGLSLSMSVCLFIIMIIREQMAIDSHIPEKDQIYRVITDTGRKNKMATSPYEISSAVSAVDPAVENYAVFNESFRGEVLANGKKLGMKGMFASENALKFFGYEMLYGNQQTALTKAFTIVLAQHTSEKFFGKGINPIGKQFTLFTSVEEEPQHYQVTGVIAENGTQTHLKFDALGSAESIQSLEDRGAIRAVTPWENIYTSFNYLKLKKNASPEKVEENMAKLAANGFVHPDFKDTRLLLQPLEEVTPFKEEMTNAPEGVMPMFVLWFLGGIAGLIMFMAGFNYTNLSIARSLNRAREVGIRKVSGANKGQIIIQFLMEAMLISLISLGFGIFFLQWVIDGFMSIDPAIHMFFKFKSDWMVYGLFILFALSVGFFAGIIPASFMARFHPAKVLKGFGQLGNRKFTARKILVVAQFCISMVFVVTALTSYDQFQHTMSADLGLNGENVINIPLQGNKPEIIKTQFEKLPEVTETSLTNLVLNTNRKMGLYLSSHESVDSFYVNCINASSNFIPMMNIDLLVGDIPADGVKNQILINEKTVKLLGFKNPTDALGSSWTIEKEAVMISGVLKDFSYASAQDLIGPFIIRSNLNAYNNLSIKVNSEDFQALKTSLTNAWQEIDQEHEFEFHFYRDQLEEAQVIFVILSKIIGFAGVLSVSIAAFGLLGMAIYNTNSRNKEMGIRKALGANLKAVFTSLSGSFITLLGISILLALPLSWWINDLWLQNFPYRINISYYGLGLGALIILSAGMLAIGSQVVRVIRLNPVDILRDE
ncbi:FtsX-like permease family protein [Flexithrix dorotheae]|uniref:FtsX-like permease family protein n=1 Tax=Flexithrix dorotheae TaxID=70993 RepID=UPI0003669796|nr:FtsX-like permease family protein [Flexithrix dorotheae]